MINDRTHLLSLMQKGAIVITPNNRLAKELMDDFLKSSGKQMLDKPLCLAYSAFLQRCFKKLCHESSTYNHPILLTSEQLNYLWRQILKKTQPVNDGLLKAVADAWSRCHLWQIDFNNPAFAFTPQTRQFQQWALTLQHELTQLGAITEEQLVDYLLKPVCVYRNETLIWACFDDYTPQQLALQDRFCQAGNSLYHYDLDEQPNQVFCYAAKNEQDELQQLLYWLNEGLAAGAERIAVVVPHLQTESKPLQRLLKQQLGTEQFNISLGQPLASFPLVAHALCWLNLDGETLSTNQAQLLLQSPYLAFSQTEMLARAQLMENSTLLHERHFTQAFFISQLQNTAPKLAELFKTFNPYPNTASVQDWVMHFKQRLLAFGFPGEYSLDSPNYQCYQRFLMLFDEFRQLALLTQTMSKSEAYTAFNDLANSAIFQAKKNAVTIQILGLLEAAGCSFERLWVSGLTEQCLPQNVQLCAFIPLELQRTRSMPHACPNRELQLAKKALKRLAACSPHVIFSYPCLTKDKPNLPSSLITPFPPFSPYKIDSTACSSLVHCSELHQISLANDEPITGGTALLANQAKCPFRAFAAHRLHAQRATTPSDGPDAKERGRLIHKVMELLWQTLKNQQTLLTLTAERLNYYIEQAIEQALEPLIQARPYSFSTLIQEVEFAKLKRLVHVCLAWERQRPPFVIEALEQAFTIQLAGIDFRVRVDRLDSNEDGKKWVIDYKSSLPQTLPWQEERPKEPQLLLYALLDEAIDSLLLIQLKAGQIHCKGLSAEKQAGFSVIKKNEKWTDYRQRWQMQLTQLAEEFSQGYCLPQPTTPSICQHCDFQDLCRFNPNFAASVKPTFSSPASRLPEKKELLEL